MLLYSLNSREKSVSSRAGLGGAGKVATYPQNSSTESKLTTLIKASSHDLALSCLEAESNQSCH